MEEWLGWAKLSSFSLFTICKMQASLLRKMQFWWQYMMSSSCKWKNCRAELNYPPVNRERNFPHLSPAQFEMFKYLNIYQNTCSFKYLTDIKRILKLTETRKTYFHHPKFYKVPRFWTFEEQNYLDYCNIFKQLKSYVYSSPILIIYKLFSNNSQTIPVI